MRPVSDKVAPPDPMKRELKVSCQVRWEALADMVAPPDPMKRELKVRIEGLEKRVPNVAPPDPMKRELKAICPGGSGCPGRWLHHQTR